MDKLKNAIYQVFGTKESIKRQVKSTIVFLIIGIVGYIVGQMIDGTAGTVILLIGCISLIFFGYKWAMPVTSAVAKVGDKVSGNNAVLKWFAVIFSISIGSIFGYIFFVISLIRLIFGFGKDVVISDKNK